MASLVAAACLTVALVLSTALDGGAGDAAAAPAGPDPSVVANLPHGQGVPGVSESELRRIEAATLGAGHAREHALMREAARELEGPLEAAPATLAAALDDPLDVADDPSVVGRWDPVKAQFPVVAIHAAMLPTGKVMFFSFPLSPRENSAQAWLWDPVSKQLTRRDPPLLLDPMSGRMKPANIWCSGHTFTEDGELVVFGGNLELQSDTSDWKGLDKVYTFDPWTETWRQQPDMRHGRWYPSGVRLADGRIPILSGYDESGIPQMNEDIELFNPPPARGELGSVSLIGGTGGPGQPPTREYYPHMFAMPSNRAFVVGPNRDNTWFMNNPGPSSFTWTEAPDMSQRRLWGTAVMLPGSTSGSTRIMALGGTNYSLDPSTTTTEVFDEAAPGQGWRQAASNIIGRGHANTVLLPDGSMVQVGGGVGRDNSQPSPQHAALPEQKQIELWDPATGQWRLGPAQQESRAYHSTALLLPDGRVLSAGDDWNGGQASDTGEIYEPPYLFRGPRPTISAAPAEINVGGDFGVTTPNTNIRSAALVAPGSVTHAVDMNQRFVPLQVNQRNGCVDLTAPPSVHAATPGYYMLFLLNDQGVPSIAKFVRLRAGGANPGTCDAPPLPPDTTPPTGVSITSPTGGATLSGSVDIAATAQDNVGVANVRFLAGDQNVGPADTSAPYSATWDTSAVANGTYQLRAVARDAAGNETSSASVSVTVDNRDRTPPTVSLVAPQAGSSLKDTVRVTASASDDVALGGVQLEVDGEPVGPEDTAAPYAWNWNTKDVPNGTRTLRATARDTSDNETESAPVTVTVDNPPPPEEPPPIEQPPAQPPLGRPKPPAPRPVPKPAPDLAPRITKLKLRPRTFRRPAGTRISFHLSEAATVRLSFARRRAGRRVRYAPLASRLTVRAQAGSNALRFRGRLPRNRKLAAGSYRLTLVATDAAGKRSTAARATFKLMEAKRKRPRAALITSWLARPWPVR